MANKQFYESKRWQTKRKNIMRKYNYEDQESKRYGKTKTAQMVHHIYPLTDYPELRFQDWNLIPLTNLNHAKMHDRFTNEISPKGKVWQLKRKREFEKYFQSKNSPTKEKL